MTVSNGEALDLYRCLGSARHQWRNSTKTKGFFHNGLKIWEPGDAVVNSDVVKSATTRILTYG
uniref:Uncharacterized protein n=1 Tax=Oryza rufipogon TaxID=4529 RepID=A0A0E0NSH1_ORYRU